jgi:hypothetical protein
MADRTQWMVILGDDKLAIARADGPQIKLSAAHNYDRGSPAETAQQIHQLLEEQRYLGRPVLLGLGSTFCLSATISVQTSRQAKKRGTIGFLVEPHLPWSAEEAVIDYEILNDDKRIFAVSAEARPLADLVSTLEEHGVRVASIAPLARLALEHHFKLAPNVVSRYALLWRNEETIDLWLVEQDRPVLWNWLPYDIAAVSRALRYLAISEDVSLQVVSRNLPQEFVGAALAQAGLGSLAAPSLESDDLLVAATHEAAAILEGRHAAPIELRRDQLVAKDRNRVLRPQLKLLQGAALLCLAALGIALFNQGWQSERLRDAFDRRQTILFSELFPKERVPVAIHARLQSELGRLKGVRGERSDLPESIPYLTVIEPLLKALPTDLRYRLLEVRIENGQLDLVGQVRAHADADRIAEALRGVGLVVASPNTNRLEKEGVEFRISAHVVLPESRKPQKKAT